MAKKLPQAPDAPPLVHRATFTTAGPEALAALRDARARLGTATRERPPNVAPGEPAGLVWKDQARWLGFAEAERDLSRRQRTIAEATAPAEAVRAGRAKVLVKARGVLDSRRDAANARFRARALAMVQRGSMTRSSIAARLGISRDRLRRILGDGK